VISATFDCKGKQDGFYKDPENPHFFFECTGGRAANFTCPENLVFDETLKACDFIHPPNGTTTAHTIAPLTTVPTTQKATTAAPTTKATTAAPTTQATTAAPTISSTFDCKGKKDAFYKDPENAHNFFQRIGGRAVQYLTCAENLVFDEKKQDCDFSETTAQTTSVHTLQPTASSVRTTRV
jgi:hypothetical protein